MNLRATKQHRLKPVLSPIHRALLFSMAIYRRVGAAKQRNFQLLSPLAYAILILPLTLFHFVCVASLGVIQED